MCAKCGCGDVNKTDHIYKKSSASKSGSKKK